MKPYIIVFSHEKGGTGKSTICSNVAIGLSYLNYKVAVFDLDMRQGSATMFFQNRKKTNLTSPSFDAIMQSNTDSKEISRTEDLNALNNLINKHSDCDFILIDTSGSYTNFTIFSIGLANLLITPVSESFVDIDVLVRISHDKKHIYSGPFSELVFEQKKHRLLNNKNSFPWLIITNRASSMPQEHSRECDRILTLISSNIGAENAYKITDRLVYKESFSHGLTVFDIPYLTNDMTMITRKAYDEMNGLIFKIVEYHNVSLS